MEYHWFNEPRGVRLKLNEDYRKTILEKLKGHGGPCVISRKIGSSPATICHYFQDQGMTVGFTRNICGLLQIPHEEIEKNIIEIGWLKNVKLPISLNTVEIAILSAAVLGDGSNTTRVMYKNKDIELIERIENVTRKIFGKDIIIDHRVSEENIPYIILPRITERVLSFVGVPYGKRNLQNPGMPDCIITGNNEIKKVFLQQFFDDEGSVEPDYRKISLSQTIACTKIIPKKFYDEMAIGKSYYKKDISRDVLDRIEKPKILIDTKNVLLQTFSIDSYFVFKRIKRYKTHATAFWELVIDGKKNTEKFAKEINFYCKRKKDNLEFMINRNYNMPTNIYCLILSEAIKICKEKDFFRPSEISKALGFPFKHIFARIRVLTKMGILNKNKEKYAINIKGVKDV